MFTKCMTQVIIAPTDIYDLNYQTVKMIIDLYFPLYGLEEEDKVYVFDSITEMFHHYLDRSKDKVAAAMEEFDKFQAGEKKVKPRKKNIPTTLPKRK